jgi:hypothetical protein
VLLSISVMAAGCSRAGDSLAECEYEVAKQLQGDSASTPVELGLREDETARFISLCMQARQFQFDTARSDSQFREGRYSRTSPYLDSIRDEGNWTR